MVRSCAQLSSVQFQGCSRHKWAECVYGRVLSKYIPVHHLSRFIVGWVWPRVSPTNWMGLPTLATSYSTPLKRPIKLDESPCITSRFNIHVEFLRHRQLTTDCLPLKPNSFHRKSARIGDDQQNLASNTS